MEKATSYKEWLKNAKILDESQKVSVAFNNMSMSENEVLRTHIFI